MHTPKAPITELQPKTYLVIFNACILLFSRLWKQRHRDRPGAHLSWHWAYIKPSLKHLKIVLKLLTLIIHFVVCFQIFLLMFFFLEISQETGNGEIWLPFKQLLDYLVLSILLWAKEVSVIQMANAIGRPVQAIFNSPRTSWNNSSKATLHCPNYWRHIPARAV